MKYVNTFECFLNESKKNIKDFKNSKNRFLVGLKSGLLKDLKMYDYEEDGDEIHFFDKGGDHFATLFNKGSSYQELRHDGSVKINGSRKISLRGNRNVLEFHLKPDSVDVMFYHPNMGKIKWFSIDKEGNFVKTTNATEIWIIKQLKDIFDDTKMKDELDMILSCTMFSKWWKDIFHRLRGKLASDKFMPK